MIDIFHAQSVSIVENMSIQDAIIRITGVPFPDRNELIQYRRYQMDN